MRRSRREHGDAWVVPDAPLISRAAATVMWQVTKIGRNQRAMGGPHGGPLKGRGASCLTREVHVSTPDDAVLVARVAAADGDLVERGREQLGELGVAQSGDRCELFGGPQ